MAFRISYWQLLRTLLLINAVAVICVGAVQYFAFAGHQINYQALAGVVGVVSTGMLFQLAMDGPPLLLQIDKPAGVVVYTRLFRAPPKVVLEYKRVYSEFTIRRSGTSYVNGWALFYNGEEQFFVPFNASGWTQAQLTAVHNLLKHSS